METTTQTQNRNGRSIMRKAVLLSLSLALVGLSGAALPGCAETGPDIDRTQANLVDKSIFEGDWWYSRGVQALDDDAAWAISAAGAGAPWPGAMANFDIASRSGVMGRIRWVIDQNYLYAYRTHEIVAGGAADADSPEFHGEPLAIFPIVEHVDVRRQYSPVTGEPTNVLAESNDRRWYDRQYLRVDWHTNLVSFGLFGAGLELDDFFATFTRESVDRFVQEGGDPRDPDSWRPQFVRIGDDRDDYRWQDEWPDTMDDTVHFMSFVTHEVWTPLNCPDSACRTSIQLSLRNSFLRIPPNHEYAVETLSNSDYDRFGIIRTEARTYIRGGQDRSSVGAYCDAAATATCSFDDDCGAGGACNLDTGRCAAGVLEDVDDCGAGNAANYATGRCENDVDIVCGSAACDTATHLCQGGLTQERGETDFLTYYRLRHNFYGNSLAPSEDPRHIGGECIADWQCDNRHNTVDLTALGAAPVAAELADADGAMPSGAALAAGSTCDPAANRCTIPIRLRPMRPVDYQLSPGYPRHLVRNAFEVIEEWNDTFMQGNRSLHGGTLPDGPAVACQADNPAEYCFCGSVASPEVGPEGTCAHRSDYFLEPSAREAAGETNSFDCWIALVGVDGTPVAETATVNPANPTSYADYTDEVYQYAFVGTECMLRVNVNSCDQPVAEGEDPAPCENLGDIRYQFFNYASGAGAGWCGVMQPLQDPTNGEAIAIPINMGGLCLDSIATRAIDLWPVLRGEVDESSLYTGENVRGYYERLGNVHAPVGLAPAVDGADYAPGDPSRPAMPVDLNTHLNNRFAELSPDVELLRNGVEGGGRSLTFSGRQRLLAGTSMERRLVEGLALESYGIVDQLNPLAAANLNEQGVTHSSDAMMNRISPFRDGFRELVNADNIRETTLANNFIYMPREAIFTSRYNQWWAEAFRDRPTGEAGIRWRQAFHRVVMLHELGHGLGLEHNFAASYDRDHYADGYFNVVTETDAAGDHVNALPRFETFDCGVDGLCDGDPGWTAPDEGEGDNQIAAGEATAWSDELRRVRTERSHRGLGNTMTSSLMDYNGDFSDMSGLGHYDRGAVYYNYFNLAEAFVGDPIYHGGAATSLDGLLRSDSTDRQLWTWYRGGEACNADTDCPYASGSEALTSGQPIYQRCIRNLRYSGIPEACGGDRNCMCSSYDEDFIDYYEGAAFDSDTNGDGIPDFARVEYLFCSNSRLNDISWCNVFDAGESFQESIDHFRQVWQEGYPRNYFRNYRRGFSSGSRALRYILDVSKIYQHLLFRYWYEPEFRREIGPLGFNDQYLASVDGMNWLAELAQLPDVGSYQLALYDGPEGCHPTDPTAAGNPAECRYGYHHMGDALDMPGSDINLGSGQGFHTWSRYQDGLYGFFRMERAGVFWDKLLALQALTVRDWGLSFTIDERFFINFYTLFPIEMTELFGAYITDDDFARAPRMRIVDGEPHVQYVNLTRGSCRNPTTGAVETCVGTVEERFTNPPILGTSNEVLRQFATIFALSEFPVYFNPSFESRLQVFKLDNADGFTIPDTGLDGTPTLAFGSAIPGSGHTVTTDPTAASYIVYVSDRVSQPYVAVKVFERAASGDRIAEGEEEQIGFQILHNLYGLQEEVRALDALGAAITPAQRTRRAALQRRLTSGESFLEALIDVQRAYGITSIF